MSLAHTINAVSKGIWGLPSLIFILGVAVYVTLQLGFVQLRFLKRAVKLVFDTGQESDSNKKNDSLSPLQAFINTLGANIGNGSLAGIGVALSAGGAGAIVWLMVLATFSAALRYAEVFLVTYFVSHGKRIQKQSPIAYMGVLPGGRCWEYFATALALGFMLVGGNLAQCHAVGLVVKKSLGINEFATGFIVLAFIAYIFMGGAQRIVAALNKMVPFKVFLFLITAMIMLIYHYQNIPGALYIIFHSALHPEALQGGTLGFALQNAIAVGFQQSVFASEAGLGTAAVAFSTTKSTKPVESGILAMLGVFINVHVVCFLVALCLIASGVWNCGETSSALIVAAYETVFGSFGSWLVLLLVVNFAMSVLVAAAFNGKRCWDYIFGKNASWLFPLVFSGISFCGTWMHVELVWSLNNIVNALLLVLNLIGLVWSIDLLKKELKSYSVKHG